MAQSPQSRHDRIQRKTAKFWLVKYTADSPKWLLEPNLGKIPFQEPTTLSCYIYIYISHDNPINNHEK